MECGSLLSLFAARACPRVLLAFAVATGHSERSVPRLWFCAKRRDTQERAPGSTASRAREIRRISLRLRITPRCEQASPGLCPAQMLGVMLTIRRTIRYLCCGLRERREIAKGSKRLRRFAVNPQRYGLPRLVQDVHFVAVLIAALIQNRLHFVFQFRPESEAVNH